MDAGKQVAESWAGRPVPGAEGNDEDGCLIGGSQVRRTGEEEKTRGGDGVAELQGGRSGPGEASAGQQARPGHLSRWDRQPLSSSLPSPFKRS